jgi:flagellar biogenesis protein FliO
LTQNQQATISASKSLGSATKLDLLTIEKDAFYYGVEQEQNILSSF